jgi:hypothetical protein
MGEKGKLFCYTLLQRTKHRTYSPLRVKSLEPYISDTGRLRDLFFDSQETRYFLEGERERVRDVTRCGKKRIKE